MTKQDQLKAIADFYSQQLAPLALAWDLESSDLAEIMDTIASNLENYKAEVEWEFSEHRKYPDGLKFTVPAGLVGTDEAIATIISAHPSDSIKVSDLLKPDTFARGINMGHTSSEGVAYLCQISGCAHAASVAQETVTRCIEAKY